MAALRILPMARDPRATPAPQNPVRARHLTIELQVLTEATYSRFPAVTPLTQKPTVPGVLDRDE